LEDATEQAAAVLTLIEWALKWNISPNALKELAQTCMHFGDEENTKPEASVQREVRLEAARLDKLLFRNNRGAGKMESGNFVRYGLANDSKKLGDAVKSADLIGIERVVITEDMVGKFIGRFLSVEVKAGNWRYTGTPEEVAQVSWATTVNHYGGRAIITNRIGTL
jgi:hypothetical protein